MYINTRATRSIALLCFFWNGKIYPVTYLWEVCDLLFIFILHGITVKRFHETHKRLRILLTHARPQRFSWVEKVDPITHFLSLKPEPHDITHQNAEFGIISAAFLFGFGPVFPYYAPFGMVRFILWHICGKSAGSIEMMKGPTFQPLNQFVNLSISLFSIYC